MQYIFTKYVSGYEKHCWMLVPWICVWGWFWPCYPTVFLSIVPGKMFIVLLKKNFNVLGKVISLVVVMIFYFFWAILIAPSMETFNLAVRAKIQSLCKIQSILVVDLLFDSVSRKARKKKERKQWKNQEELLIRWFTKTNDCLIKK